MKYFLIIWLSMGQPIVFEYNTQDECSQAKLTVFTVLDKSDVKEARMVCAGLQSEASFGPLSK